MSFGFVTSETSGIPVVAFEGEVDGASIEPFEAAIIEAAMSADNCVIVDLQKVTYIDSQAFGRLLKAHINLEQVGGDVAIIAGVGDIARVIRILGGDCLLGVFDDRDTAVAFLEPLLSH
jgi:anti-sigma B factor antagonist